MFRVLDRRMITVRKMNLRRGSCMAQRPLDDEPLDMAVTGLKSKRSTKGNARQVTPYQGSAVLKRSRPLDL